MTLLELIISLIGFVFLLFAIDLFQRKKFNALHFLVFFGGTAGVVIFALRPDLLDEFGEFFGVARGADLLVYLAIIFLAYLYFELINQQTKLSQETTRLVSGIAQQNSHSIGNYEEIQNSKKTTFLIRAYNEERTIGTVLEEILRAGWNSIIVCNDGSRDGTEGEVCKIIDKAKGTAQIILLTHPINRGGGAANKTLFSFAAKNFKKLGCDRFVTYDGDGQMNISDMKKFMNYAGSGSDSVLLGSRFIDGGNAKNISTMRRVILWGSKFVTLAFNKLRVSDPHNGFRMIRSDVIGKIKIDSDGMMYASEILSEIKSHKLSWREVPVNISYTEYSISKGQKNSNALKILKGLIYRGFFYK